MTQLHRARVKAGPRAGDKAKTGRVGRGATYACVHGLNLRLPGVARVSAARQSGWCAARRARQKKMGRAGEHSAQVFGRAWLSPRARWRLASGGVGVAAGGRRRGGRPRLAAQTADFFLRGRTLDPAEAMQTVGLEPELEGDSPPTRELAGASKFPRAGLHALQSLAQVSPLSCHKGKFSAGPGLTAGTLRVTPNDLGIVHEDTVYASLRQRPREFVGASAKGIALSSRAPLQLARAWNFYFSFQSLPFAAIYAAYREWLNAAHRRWLGELDLYKRAASDRCRDEGGRIPCGDRLRPSR